MITNNPTDTLSGAYTVATIKMPDGTESPILVRKIVGGDGKVKMMVIDDSLIEFESRFSDTTTQPADLMAPQTETFIKNEESDTIRKEQSTRIKMISADMIQFVGDPDRIIEQKGLDPERFAHMKAHPSSATMARRICINMGGKWAQVAQYIPKFYPDSKPGEMK